MTDPYGGRDPMNPWGHCACGHLWMTHDIEEYTGDGSETCCVVGCGQTGCPGRSVQPRGETMAGSTLRSAQASGL